MATKRSVCSLPTTAQHLPDGGAEVVVAQRGEDASEPLESLDVSLEEGLLGLPWEGDMELASTEAGADE